MSHPDPPTREFSLDDERTAAVALAVVSLRRGIRFEKQVLGVRNAMTRLEELGLAVVDHDDHARCNLTDAGRTVAREFLRSIRATMRRLGQKARAA